MFKEKLKTILNLIGNEVRKLKSDDEIIKEIHKSFYTEVDRLLAESGAPSLVESDKNALIEKSKRLENIGFIKSKEVKESYVKINSSNHDNKSIKALGYFSIKYPNYKFITEDIVKNICKKYKLSCFQVVQYKGTVPDKNIKHIEEFKIQYEDMAFRVFCNSRSWAIDMQIDLDDAYSYGKKGHPYIVSKLPLEIVADEKESDMINERTLYDNSPPLKCHIVLQPVMFEKTKYYLIVTAW